jgi:hypothetical protein
MNTQQRIIASLFVLAILLLAANLLVGKIFKTENTIVSPRSLSAEEVDSLFLTAFESFGLNSSIVKKQKIKEVKIDSEYPSYSFNLPGDLPIPIFISELNELFTSYDAEVHSEEKRNSGRTLITIFSENEIKLAANADYNRELKREAATIGFLIHINDKTSKTEIDGLVNTPEPFSLLFTPSLVMKSFIRANGNSNRQFALLLGDETNDLDFKFEPGYSERRLKSSVRNLLGAFSKAVFIVIDDNSSFYSSKAYPFVEKEFLGRKIKLLKKSELNLVSSSVSNVSDQFKDMLNTADNDLSILLLCSPEDFIKLLPEIRSFRKIGYKYTVPSEILINK